MKLYMLKIGATPKGRLIEQHDMFFTIAPNVPALAELIDEFWPEVAGCWHVDGWREITQVGDYAVEVVEKTEAAIQNEVQLFFFNLGGYLEGNIEEHHHKLLIAASDSKSAIAQAKQSDFYQQFSFDTSIAAVSHIDNQYGVAIDEMYRLDDILSPSLRQTYALKLTRQKGEPDALYQGYIKRSHIEQWKA